MTEPTAYGAAPGSAVPAMDAAEFQRWARLLESRTGMTLSADRLPFLQANVGQRMLELGCSDYDTYFELVSDSVRGRLEWVTLVDRLTIHETRFFRTPEAYTVLREYLRPRLFELQQDSGVNLWSVGCSTGEEPYSLAMLAHHCCREQVLPPYYSVTGSDISLPVLMQARSGRYPARKLEQIETLYQPFAIRKQEAGFVITEELRKRTCFLQLNVMDLENAPIGEMQVIFCFNLLIYFRHWLRRQVLNRLVQKLRPGGLLVIGPGDSRDWHPEGMQPLQAAGVQAYIKSSTGG